MAIANTVIQIKKSGVTGNVPSSLNLGELALNYVDNKLFYKNASGGTSWFYGANNGPSFSTVSNGTSLITATAPNDTLTFATANGISISTNSSTKIITVGLSGITSTPTLNITGNIPTTSNTTGSLIVTGGIGVSDNVYSTGSQSVFRGNVNIGSVVTGSNYPLDVTSSGNDTTVRSYTSAAGAWFMAYSTAGYYAGMKYVGANGARSWFSGMGNGNQAYTLSMSIDGASNRFFTIDTTGYISLAGAPGSESFRAAPVANSVNYLQVAGAATGNFPGLSSQGSDSTINIGYFAKGGGYHFFYGSNSAQLGILPTANAVNYIGVTGAATGGYPTFSAQGSDANIGLMYDAKGSGNQYFRAQSSAIQFAIGSTANAVNYMMAYGSTAGNYPVLTSLGSDTNIGFVFNSKGSGAVAFQTNYLLQAQVSYTANAVNFLNFTGGATGAAPTISTLSYTDANVSMNIASQGFGVVNVNTGTGTIAKFQDRGTTTVNSPFIFRAGLAGTASGALTFPVSPNLQSPDPSDFTFNTNAGTGGGQGGSTQVVIGHTATTVNYLRLTGSAANNAPSISALGSDSNINLNLNPKGNGNVNAGSSPFNTLAGINIGSSLNYIYQASANSLGFRVGTAPSYFQFTDNAGSIGLATGNPFYFTGWSGGYTFKIEGSASANVVNYLSVGTANTATSPTLYANGSDTNVSLALQPKGTGSINLVAGANGINFGSSTFINSIKIGQTGVGYTSFPTVVVSAPTMQGGTQAVAGAISSMKNVTATVQSGGTGYTVGDVLSIVGGVIQASNGTLTVATVSSGVITAVNTTNFAPYGTPLQANPVSVTGGTGTGATFNIGYGVYSGSVSLTNSGSGYIEPPTITFTGGGTPSVNAVGYATVGNATNIKSLGSSLSLYTSLGEQLRLIDGALSTSGGIVNYIGITASSTGSNPTISVAGTDPNITMAFQQKGTGNFQFNGSGTVALQVFTTPLSSVNYFRLSPALTNNPPTINALGSDANVGLRLSPQGTGSVIVTGPMTVANTVNAVSQFAVSLQPNFSTSGTWANTAATFGGIAAGGSSAAAAVGIAFDTTTGGQLVSVAPGQGWYNMRYGANQHTFQIAGATHFNIINTSSAVNYLQVTGGTTGNATLISAQGSDTNVPLALQSKGTGGIDFAAGADGVNISNGNTVTSLKLTSIGSGYTTVPTITISAPTTTGGVTATANVFDMGIWGVGVNFGGTGYSANDVLTLVGGTVRTSAITLKVTTISANVITGVTVLNYGSYSALPTNPITVTGGTGANATVNATWCVYGTTLLTSGSGYVEQPTVTFSTGGGAVAANAYATIGSSTSIKSLGTQLNLQTSNNNTSLQILDDSTTPTSNTSLYVIGASSGLGRLAVRSSKAFYMSTFGGQPFGFFTNGSVAAEGQQQFGITNTGSSVNYINITGGITNGAPILSALGSDTNINILIAPKGTGSVALGGVAVANSSLQVTSVTNSVNYIKVDGAANTAAPIISAQGSDSNINLKLLPKGTGYLYVGNIVNIGADYSIGATISAAGQTSAVVGTSLQGFYNAQTIDSTKTAGFNIFSSFISTAAAAFNITSIAHYKAAFFTLGAGSSITNQYGFIADGSLGNATNTYGFYSNIAAASGRYNFYAQGTADNVFAGQTSLGGLAGSESLRVSPVANSVNYVAVQGSGTGQPVYISASGSDTNIALIMQSKGTQPFYFVTNNAIQFATLNTNSAINYLYATGGTTGGAGVLAATGNDANVSIFMTPKGTGNVTITSTTASTSVNTGSLIVLGGLGVSGNVYANGIYAVSALYANGISVSGGGGTSTFPTLNVTGNIPSTSNTTGSLIVTGGVGVSGNVYAGTIYASGAQLTNRPTVVVYSMIFGGS